MKRIIAFILVLSLAVSSAAFLAGAEHTHKPGTYIGSYGEYGHNFICGICGTPFYDDHVTDENGKCDCGYMDHEHSADLYPAYDDQYHMYKCVDCGAEILEDHVLDETGECICGYMDHEHVVRLYNTIYTQYTHTYMCKTCGAFITENHKVDENGKCGCGYIEHVHTTDAYLIEDYFHGYMCYECLTEVIEDHEFDENGKCVCGYVDPESADFFSVMMQPLTKFFSYFKFYFSVLRLALDGAFGIL